jgi:hypothetical protein
MISWFQIARTLPPFRLNNTVAKKKNEKQKSPRTLASQRFARSLVSVASRTPSSRQEWSISPFSSIGRSAWFSRIQFGLLLSPLDVVPRDTKSLSRVSESGAAKKKRDSDSDLFVVGVEIVLVCHHSASLSSARVVGASSSRRLYLFINIFFFFFSSSSASKKEVLCVERCNSFFFVRRGLFFLPSRSSKVSSDFFLRQQLNFRQKIFDISP